MKKTVAILSFLVCCLPAYILAHPGHGETEGYTIIHYFSEPLHLIVSALLLIGVVLYIRYTRRNKQSKADG